MRLVALYLLGPWVASQSEVVGANCMIGGKLEVGSTAGDGLTFSGFAG